MSRSIIISVFIFSSFQISAQPGIDSLWTVWNSYEHHDTVRLKALYLINWQQYMNSKPDSALILARQQLSFAESRGLNKQIGDALYTIANAYRVKNDFKSAIDHHLRALNLRKEIDDKRGISRSFNGIGNIYKDQGNYEIASDYYQRSKEIKEEIGDKRGLGTTHINLGVVSKMRGDLSQAITHYRTSLRIKEALNDKKGVSISLNNIADIYKIQGLYDEARKYYTRSLRIREELGDDKGEANSLNNLGNVAYNQGDYGGALGYYNRSLVIGEEIQDFRGISSALNNIGNINFDRGDFQLAIDYYERSLAIKEDIGYKKGIAVSLNNLGNTYSALELTAKAIEYNVRSLEMAKEIGALEETMDAAKSLYENYKISNNPKLSLEMLELYVSTRDRLLSEETKRDLIRNEFKYEYEKIALADSIENARTIQAQNILLTDEKAKNDRKQQLAYILYAGITVLTLFLIILYNRFRIATERKLIMEKQKLVADANNQKLMEKNQQIQAQADQIIDINSEIKQINESLESRVEERTKKIELQNRKLKDYAFSNSHEVRAPLTKLMGLIDLWDKEGVTEEEKVFLSENISQSAKELDDIIRKLNDQLRDEDLSS